MDKLYTFPQALTLMRSGTGQRFARQGWNADDIHVEVADGDLGPIFVLTLPGKPLKFWLPAQTDMLGIDWYAHPAAFAPPGPTDPDAHIKGSFSAALEEMMLGRRAAREGWHGQGQFLYVVPGSTFDWEQARTLQGLFPKGSTFAYQPHIDIRLTDQGYRVGEDHGAPHRLAPWTATRDDIIACDWTVLPEDEA